MNKLSCTSSSLHVINGDESLGKFDRWLYFWLNRLSNSVLLDVNSHIPIRRFTLPYDRPYDIQSSSLPRGSSPSRRLSDLFWMNLPWNVMQQEFGELHIVDVGCGKGLYGARLKDWSGQRISSYTGFDVTKADSWNEFTATNARFRFVQCSASKFSEHIPTDTNFFITQSALEHIEDDMTYFRHVAAHIRRTRKPVFQVHLVPSPVCLHLYGLHGVRQYSPRTVARIASIFKDTSYVLLFELGGSRCNQLHWEYITKPLRQGRPDHRSVQPELYDQLLRAAIEHDMHYGGAAAPSYYAVVIHSHWNNRIF